VDAHEADRSIVHGIFVERKWVVQHVAPEHRGNDFAAIEAIAVRFAAGRPAGIEVRADFFRLHDANGRREQRV